MRRALTIITGAVVAAPLVLALAVPAGADPPGGLSAVQAPSSATQSTNSTTKTPTTKITAADVFSPTHAVGPVDTPATSGGCTTTLYTVAVKNLSSVIQQMTYGGKAIKGFKVKPGKTLDICAVAGTYVFGLKGFPERDVHPHIRLIGGRIDPARGAPHPSR